MYGFEYRTRDGGDPVSVSDLRVVAVEVAS